MHGVPRRGCGHRNLRGDEGPHCSRYATAQTEGSTSGTSFRRGTMQMLAGACYASKSPRETDSGVQFETLSRELYATQRTCNCKRAKIARIVVHCATWCDCTRRFNEHANRGLWRVAMTAAHNQAVRRRHVNQPGTECSRVIALKRRPPSPRFVCRTEKILAANACSPLGCGRIRLCMAFAACNDEFFTSRN